MDPKIQDALNTITAALGGAAPTASSVPWYRDTSGPAPTSPLPFGTATESQIKSYMAHGFRTNLVRGVAPTDRSRYLGVADKIMACQTWQQADDIVAGAGHFDPNVAVLLLLGGGAQGMGPFQSPSLFAPWGSGFDLFAADQWLTAPQGYAGPGIQQG